MLPRRVLVIIASIALLAPIRPSFGVILYRSAQRNTAAPTGAFANSGWQYQGQFGSFLATPIASQYFITAQHIGGDFSINYNGTSYGIDTSFGGGQGYVNGPGSDLRIWKINGTFPTWAPLYDASLDGSEVGKTMAVFGRGTARGDEVYAEVVTGGDNHIPGELKGWKWGAFDNVQAWGTNIVSGIINGGGSYGQLLGFDFNRDGLFDEGALSAGDSGGGVFIQSGGVWKLAAINLAVDGPWSYSETGPGFDASLFDAGGMYVGVGNNQWQYIADQSLDIAGTSYSTRIASNLGWIRGIIGPGFDVPEPASAALMLVSGATLALRRRSRELTAGIE